MWRHARTHVQSHCEMSFTLPTCILAGVLYQPLDYSTPLSPARKERRSAWRLRPHGIAVPLRKAIHLIMRSSHWEPFLSSSLARRFYIQSERLPPHLSSELLSQPFLINLIHTCVYSVNPSRFGGDRALFMDVYLFVQTLLLAAFSKKRLTEASTQTLC